jgi:hypothetical protein
MSEAEKQRDSYSDALVELEPQIADTAMVTRQVVKRVKSIEMVYWKGCDRFWWRKPKIDRDAAAPICF